MLDLNQEQTEIEEKAKELEVEGDELAKEQGELK